MTSYLRYEEETSSLVWYNTLKLKYCACVRGWIYFIKL